VLATKDAVYVTTCAGTPARHSGGTDVVLRYPKAGGAPVARSSVQTMPDMGLFGAAEDAEGRVYVVDMNGRILRYTPTARGLGRPEVYATDPYRQLGWRASMWMTPVFDRKGNLFVIDASLGAIWRIPPDRTPAIWFQDPRLAGGSLGTNGMTLGPDGKLYFPLVYGPLYRLPLAATPPSNDRLELFHQFTVEPGAHDTPLPGPVDLAFGRSGRLYVTLALSDRIAVLAPDGNLLREITNDAFDYPLGVRFQGRSLLVANSNYFGAENQSHWGILKVSVGEPGLPPIRPALP